MSRTEEIARISCFIILILLLSQCRLYSQPEKVFTGSKSKKANDLFNQATALMMNGRTAEAEPLLIKALKEDSNYVDAYLRLSAIYYRQGKTDLEQQQYEKVLKICPELPGIYFNYAYLYLRKKEYENAIKFYNKYLTFEDISDAFFKTATENIKICQFRDSCIKHPVPFNPENVGDGVNTELDEYWPAITADDQLLYFTRRLDQNPEAKIDFLRFNEDIFCSVYEKNIWNKATKLPAYLNAVNKNEGAITISPDGKFLLFTICVDDYNVGYGSCDIYISEYLNGEWQPPRNIGAPINTAAKETQPSISFDGNTIYFSSSQGKTYGKLDIFKSTRNPDGTWGQPINLGPEINGPENEQSPFIHPDNKTLYFSSESRMGMGGADLFMARLNENGQFGKIKNLGYPINTDQNEFSLFVNAMGDKAYFASRREGGKGGLDIYSSKLPPQYKPEPVCYLKGIVFDKETNVPLGAKFELIDLNNGKIILTSTSDAKTGKFLVAVPADKNYLINVSREGYLFYSGNLSAKGKNSYAIVNKIPLTPVKVGETVVLNNIFFDFDKSEILPQSTIELQKVIAFMNLNSMLTIEIGGHTDNIGDDAYNHKLSENRAKSVYFYLINTGKIPAGRLTFKGYGETKPIDTNDTDAGRSKNRRTEFKVTGM